MLQTDALGQWLAQPRRARRPALETDTFGHPQVGVGRHHERGRTEAERSTVLVEELDRGHHDGAARLHHPATQVHPLESDRRCLEVHVELERDRHAWTHHIDDHQSGDGVDPRRQHGGAQHVGAGHVHLGHDRRRAVELVTDALDAEAELGHDVAG